jgi:hypothetical protein
MNYILNEQHGKKIAVILNGMTTLIYNIYIILVNICLEFGDCE